MPPTAVDFGPLFLLSLYASAFLACLVAAVAALLVASKSTRRLWGEYAKSREAVYLPILLQLISEGSASGEGLMPRGTYRPGDGPFVEAAVRHWALTMKGDGFETLRRIYVAAGFADRQIKRLRSRRWWVRAKAAKRLGQMVCAKAAPALTEVLEDPSLEVRLVAAWSLGRLGKVEAVEPMMHALASHSRLAALGVANVIQEMGPRTIPVLEGLLARPDPAVQALSITLLGELRDASALPAISSFLASPDLELRVAACRALGSLGEPAGSTALRKALKDASWEVRARAAWSLGKLRAAEAVADLLEALADEAWWVRLHSGEALARLGEAGKRSLEDARSAHPDRFARDMAAQWLDELASARVR